MLLELSKALTMAFGRGFSRSNLQNMRNFYLAYAKSRTLSGKLTWNSLGWKKRRNFYQKEAENGNWSVRELKRQIKTSLDEGLLLSKEDGHSERSAQILNMTYSCLIPFPIINIEVNPSEEDDYGKANIKN